MIIHEIADKHYAFWCEGCDESHQFTDQWEFNHDFDKPTLNPSYLTWNDPNPNVDPKNDPDGKYRNGFRCHSFIRDGMIQYLDDCTHALAGQTVAMKEWKL